MRLTETKIFARNNDFEFLGTKTQQTIVDIETFCRVYLISETKAEGLKFQIELVASVSFFTMDYFKD